MSKDNWLYLLSWSSSRSGKFGYFVQLHDFRGRPSGSLSFSLLLFRSLNVEFFEDRHVVGETLSFLQ